MFQKLRNTVKTDLCEKCPKCGEKECDCFPPEENEPMLILQGPDFKSANIVTNLVPFGINMPSPNPPISRAVTDTNLNGRIHHLTNIENGNNTLPRCT